MEAFSLLRYWKSSSSLGTAKLSEFHSSAPTTIVAAVNSDSSDDDDNDDGPFFDLEFAVPADGDEEEGKEEERQKVEEREIDEEEVESNLSFSQPLDEFRFDGSDSAPLADMEQIISSAVARSAGSSGGLAKSAAKVRVFMLGLKRSKSESKQTAQENNHGKSKSMTVRLKMEELKVPKMSLLTRVTSNTVKITQTDEKLVTESGENYENENDKKDKNSNNKEVVQKYLKLVRPLYVKVSRKINNETAEAIAGEETRMTVKSSKQMFNLKKHLGKSKSAVVHSLPRSSGNNGNGKSKSTKKVDDSLLQQQDGIQSAILHCKRSFNSSSSSQDDDEVTKLVLMRSASDPSYEKFTIEVEATTVENE